MDTRFREIIEQNENKLIEETNCSETFLAIFSSKKLLHVEEIQNIKAQGSNYGNISKSKAFYSIIVTRANSYDVLLEALRDTKQTGVLEILNQNSPSPHMTPKAQKIMKFMGLPNYMDIFLSQNLIEVLIVSSKDCKITCERIIDTTENAAHFTLDYFLDFISTPAGHATTSNVSVVNCDGDIDSGFSSSRNVTSKTVLVTSMDIENLTKRFSKPKKSSIKPELAEDEFTWDDLSPGYQKQLRQAINVQLQMDQNAKWFDDDDIDTESIIDIINGKKLQLLKDTLPDEIKYYVPRRIINRRKVSHEIFTKGGRDIYLFENIERHKLSELVDGKGTETSSNLVNSGYNSTCQFVLLEQAHHFEEISTKYDDRPVHVLCYEEKEFLWKRSSGSIHNVQTSLTTEQVIQTENDFMKDVVSRNANERYPICISDTPGMGKSVLLAHFVRVLMRELKCEIICFVVINEFVKIIKESIKRSPVTKEAIVSSLIKYSSRNKLGEVYLKIHTNQIKELMFDGFDELNSEDIFLGYEILRIIRSEFHDTRTWVTTRPHMFLELEKVLLVLGSNIQAFSEEDQINFLESFWCRNDSHLEQIKNNPKLNSFAKGCISSLKSTINKSEDDIAGIPLQCMLIGEVFETEAMRCRNVEGGMTKDDVLPNVPIKSMVDLYERLIKKKIQQFHSNYNNQQIPFAQLIKVHTHLSVMLLFPSCLRKLKNILCPQNSSTDLQQIFDVGILESRSILPAPRFIHRTFAEYFVAKFIVDTYEDSTDVNVLNFLHSHVLKTIVCNFKIRKLNFNAREFKHNVVCYFINALLSQQCELKINANINRPTKGTTLFQITEACVYNDFYEIYRNCMHKFVTNDDYKKKVFDERFLKLVVLRSNTLMFKIALHNLTISNNICITDITEDIYTLLHLAVIRGDYKLAETIVNTGNFKELLSRGDEKFHNLLHECVQDTKHSSSRTINDKISIISYLKSINEFLLSYKNTSDKLPIECERVNTNLVFHLINCGQIIFLDNDQLLRIAHNMTKSLNSEEYLLFLQNVFKDKDELYCSRVINTEYKQSTLLKTIFSSMKPEAKLMEYLKMHRAEFKSPKSMSAICLATKYKKGQNSLKWLLDNIEWTHEDIKQALLVKSNQEAFIKTLIHGQYINKWKELAWIHLVCNRPTMYSGHLELTQYLISNGADVNTKDENSKTAMDFLIQANCNKYSLEIFNLLQETSNSSTDLEYTKLRWFIEKSDERNQHELMQSYFKNMKYNSIYFGQDYEGNTLLHIAATKNNIDKVKLAFICCPDINVTNNLNETPLHLITQAVNSFCIECWKFFVDKNANIWAKNKKNNTPVSNLFKLSNSNFCLDAILYAIEHYDNEEVVVKLTQTNLRDEDGNTVLHLAAKNHHLQIVQILLKASFDVNAVNNDKQSPLHLVTNISKKMLALECWKILIDYGADIFLIESDDYSPICRLKHATLTVGIASVMYILTKHMHTNDSSIERIIWLVIKSLDLQVIKCVCDWYKTNFQAPLEKISVNSNGNWSTFLDAAFQSANGDVLEYVLEDLKCSTFLSDSPGHSVIMCMEKRTIDLDKRLKFIKVLTEHYPNLDLLNSPNDNGLVPLSHKKCNENFVQIFVELGANVNAQDLDNNTPLHHALKHDQIRPINLIKQLIKFGADVNAVNNQHHTPLLLALRQQYEWYLEELACLLINNKADPTKTDSARNNFLHVLLDRKFSRQFNFSNVFKCILDNEYYDIIESRNNAGLTPLMVAKQSEFPFYKEMVEIMRKYNLDT